MLVGWVIFAAWFPVGGDRGVANVPGFVVGDGKGAPGVVVGARACIVAAANDSSGVAPLWVTTASGSACVLVLLSLLAAPTATLAAAPGAVLAAATWIVMAAISTAAVTVKSAASLPTSAVGLVLICQFGVRFAVRGGRRRDVGPGLVPDGKLLCQVRSCDEVFLLDPVLGIDTQHVIDEIHHFRYSVSTVSHFGGAVVVSF